ncbi:MAG: hypothetical protein Q8N12_05380 [Thermodesulfovibrionales bacterium]|nr:hypothetical protein [Thermodesulfovibrionales bacterium]
MKIFKQITLPRILSILSILFLASCATYTPKINLTVSGMNMEINQPAQVVQKVSISPDDKYILVGGAYRKIESFFCGIYYLEKI